MKKIIITTFLLSMVLYTNSYANSFICPFTDYFTVVAPTGYSIVSLSSDGNIITNFEGSNHFSLHCKDYTSTASGKAYLTVSENNTNLCTLHITDGPYEMNPVVNFVNCAGKLKYMGIAHDKGTYTYSLMFTFD